LRERAGMERDLSGGERGGWTKRKRAGCRNGKDGRWEWRKACLEN
jgi:hypothetical protein